MLIACFPTAALILIKKYIWVRIWIAKCDLRPLDFTQNAGNAIYENQISKIFQVGMPPNPPTNMSSLWLLHACSALYSFAENEQIFLCMAKPG